jgi:hypothetical protein
MKNLLFFKAKFLMCLILISITSFFVEAASIDQYYIELDGQPYQGNEIKDNSSSPKVKAKLTIFSNTYFVDCIHVRVDKWDEQESPPFDTNFRLDGYVKLNRDDLYSISIYPNEGMSGSKSRIEYQGGGTQSSVDFYFWPGVVIEKDAADFYIEVYPDYSTPPLRIGPFKISHRSVDLDPNNNFGNQEIQSSSSYINIPVNLSGGGTDRINVSIEGENASEFDLFTDDQEIDLVSGQDHNIRVRFSPTSKGLKQATLVVKGSFFQKESALVGTGIEEKIVRPYISGYVKWNGKGLEGVVFHGVTGQPVTDSNGYYKFWVDNGWSGTVYPQKTGFTLIPDKQSYNNVNENIYHDYTADDKTLVLSGQVLLNGVGVQGVVMNGVPGNPVTDSDGHYYVVVAFQWSGTIEPQKTGYSFNPSSISYDKMGMWHDDTFSAMKDNYTVSGQVLFNNVGLEGVWINGLPGTMTDANGNFSAKIEHGSSISIIPSKTGYSFTPEKIVLSDINSNQQNKSFTGVQKTGASTKIYIVSNSDELNSASRSLWDNEIIIVKPGTYENVNLRNFRNNTSMISENGPKDTKIILGNYNNISFVNQCSNVTIDGFTLENISSSRSPLIDISGDQKIQIKNCIMKANSEYGIEINEAGDILIEGCVFTNATDAAVILYCRSDKYGAFQFKNNYIADNRRGIYGCGGDAQFYFENNTFENISSEAIDIDSAKSVSISNNIFANNGTAFSLSDITDESLIFQNTFINNDDGMGASNNDHITVFNNIFYGKNWTDYGTYSIHHLLSYNSSWYSYGSFTIDWNTTWRNTDPLFININTGDYHLQSNSPAKGKGENGYDLGAYGGEKGNSWITAPGIPATPPQIFDIEITGNYSVEEGKTINLNAKGFFSGGYYCYIKNIANWSSSDNTVLKSNGNGQFVAEKPGVATVTIEYNGVKSQHTVTVLNCSIYIMQTDSSDPIISNSLLSYQITFNNNGSCNLSNVIVTDIFDSNVTFVSAEPAPDPGTNNKWTIASMAPGESNTININVQTAVALMENTQLVNKINVQSDQTSSQEITETTNIKGTPQLVAQNSASSNPVFAGEQFTYTVQYENNGTGTAENVIIISNFDDNASPIVSNPTPSTGNNTWQIGDLQPGFSGSIDITVSVNEFLIEPTDLMNEITIISTNTDAQVIETTTRVIIPEYELSLNVNGNGTVSSSPSGINNCRNQCVAKFKKNEVITLSYVPDENWHFNTFSPNIIGGQTLIMDQNKVVDALFVIDPPEMSVIEDQLIYQSTSGNPINVTLTNAEHFSVSSSNTGLIPNENIWVEGNDINKTITITPDDIKIGSSTIILTASNPTGTITESFTVLVQKQEFDVRITNVTDKQFTISWTGKIVESGYLFYGTDTSDLDNWTRVNDDRGSDIMDDIHHITVTKLTSQTTYFIKIVSGNITDNNDGHYYSVTTSPNMFPNISNNTCQPSGFIYTDETKNELAFDSIIYIHFLGEADSQDSDTWSVLYHSENQSWELNLSNLKTKDHTAFYDYTCGISQLFIEVQGGKSGTFQMTTTAIDDQSEDIILDQIHTIHVQETENGFILPSTDVEVFHGANRSFKIVPASCFEITDVLIDEQSIGVVEQYTFTNVTIAHSIAATFSRKTYTITTFSDENGTISPSDSVLCGENKKILITPSQCYDVLDVIVNGQSVGSLTEYTFENVNQPQTIHASFVRKEYTITSSAGSNGSISESETVQCGENKLITITPDPCYHIVDVLIDNDSVGAIPFYEFKDISKSHTIHAIFSQTEYPITSTAGPNGTISSQQSVICGSDKTFTIVPDTCFKILDVMVDGESIGPLPSYTFERVHSAHTIHATFQQKEFNITSISDENGTISPSERVLCGTDKVITISPQTCFFTYDVKIDNESIGPVHQHTLENIQKDYTIQAIFRKYTHSIISSARIGGSITSSDENIECGTDKTFHIVPDLGFEIVDVIVNNQSQGAMSSYTFTNIMDDNQTIEAVFGAVYNFSEGWNMFNLALMPEDSFTSKTLAEEINKNGGNILKVMRYDNESGALGTYDVERGVKEFDINIGDGYLLQSAIKSKWVNVGNEIQHHTYEFYDGFNLAGFSIDGNYMASTLAEFINEGGGEVLGIHKLESGDWVSHEVGLPVNDFKIKLNESYFIQVNGSFEFELSK